MSYASRGEKIFEFQDPNHPDCSPPGAKRSDHRLKRFYSTSDKRAWNVCESVRYRHFYEVISGSQTCLSSESSSKCHQYVPLEDLIKLLMGEKDAIIKELEDRLRKCCGDSARAQPAVQAVAQPPVQPTVQPPPRVGFQEPRSPPASRPPPAPPVQSPPKEQTPTVSSSIPENQGDLLQSREMLRQAMHKLQNIDEIVNENKKLHCRLRCSEERIKYLEEKKKRLECELADLRSKSQIRVDLERAQEMLSQVTERGGAAAAGEAAAERERLLEKIQNLERELEESRKKENEIELLKNQSKSDTMSIEEISRENECYRKKLSSMKCLEKQIQEIKKQGLALAEKYKRESQKAAEQMRKMSNVTRELQALRDERDKLLKRVQEMSSHEGEFKALQCKLKRVDAVIAENELLNNKLLALDKLEKENEYLRCRLDQIQEMEMSAIEDKERIMQLQCAVADQEEEMKDLLSQIERLTSGRPEEELERLKCELYDKSSKLKLCEEQLAEIPMLEAEIDELRRKLQCCCQNFAENKTSENRFQKIEVRLPSKSTGICAKYKSESKKTSSVLGIRREEKVDFSQVKPGSCQEILLREEKASTTVYGTDSCKDKEAMSCEEVQSLLQSSKGIISCVLEDMIEHHKEMEELEMCNRAMKTEIETLKAKIGRSDADKSRCEIENLKNVIDEKNVEICELRKCCQANSDDGPDLDTLRDLNRQMKCELEAACCKLKQFGNLEKALQQERQARCQAERALREMEEKSGPVTEEDPEFDCCRTLQSEIDDLKCQICELNKLTEELKRENELLRQLQQPCPDFSKELDEKCALENLLSLLQAELDAFKGQRLTDECEALRCELKRVMDQNCELKTLVDCYKQRLELEKKSNAEPVAVADTKKTDCSGPPKPPEKPKPPEEKAKKVPEAAPTDDCAEKLRKLMEQHKKELSDREKAYNDNLNAMKAGYETDIRKLAERHKASIMRLQGLHEDEVKELNTNHETQMETMQTQSEVAMNDIARGSAAKIRKLTAQHNKEMKNAEDKINKLQSNLAKSKEELETLRKDVPKDMQEKHDREMQKMRKSSQRRLSMMTNKYEGLLAEERKKSDTLKKNLKERAEQERGDGVCDCKFAKKKPCKVKDPTCPLDFEEVLEKILEQGLEALSFNEIALVHRKSCCALQEIVLRSNVSSVLEPPVGEGCPDVPLLQADKEQLFQRIIILENEIVLKQRQTQEAILGMEVAIKKERCRLQELKCALQSEQQRNTELKHLLTSQTKLQSDLMEERDRLGNQATLHQSLCIEKTKQLNQEKQDKKFLECQLERLKITVQKLYNALEAERRNSKADSSAGSNQGDLIQAMRTKLEQAAVQERRLAAQLENEVKSRVELQCQLQALRQSFHRMVSLPAAEEVLTPSRAPDSKSAKEKKNMDQIKERKSKAKAKAVANKKNKK